MVSPEKMKFAPYVPATEAVAVQVYVETLRAGTGPVVVVQVVTAGTPVIAQLPDGDGASAPTGPVTVAVNVTGDPRETVVEFAVTETVGVA